MKKIFILAGILVFTGLVVSADELLVNGDFSDGLIGWTYYSKFDEMPSSGVTARDGQAYHENNSGVWQRNFGIYQIVQVEEGRKYRVQGIWKGKLNTLNEGWTTIMLYCVEDPEDIDEIKARMETALGPYMVARYEEDSLNGSFGPETFNDSIGTPDEDDGFIGADWIEAVTPYIVVGTKLGGDPGGWMALDAIVLDIVD
jgi:hypothetical protein